MPRPSHDRSRLPGHSGVALSERQRRAVVYMTALQMSLRQQIIYPASTREFAERYGDFRLPTPWFHELWYTAYDDLALSRLYVQGPREHAKTSTVLQYVVRRICENHHIRVGIISGSDDLAMKFLGEIKHRLVTNEDLRRDYNEGRSFVGPTWTEHELVLADARYGPGAISGKDVTVFAAGRGSQVSSRHCDILVIDDAEDKKSVESDLVRQKTREWFAREVVPVLSPGGKFIVVGTRKHFDDLYSYLIRDPQWTVLDSAKSVYRPDGSPIWPEMWDAAALEARHAEMDTQDILAWPQEYLNEPRPSENQMFFPEQWPTYGKAPGGLTYYQYWDLAISERQEADFSVGWTIGVDEDNNVYLLEQRRGHYNFNRLLAEIEDMGQGWPGTVFIGLEDVAFQAAAIQEALRRTSLPILSQKPDKDKVTRAKLLEARAVGRKVLRPADTPPWWKSFAQEATYFPYGAHDDQVDALVGAVRLAGYPSSTISWQYGVWQCTGCGHMFMWAKGRPCQKCGRKAPDTYDNPEGAMVVNL
jgi:predicted phage terminase large subunit-like protein